MDDDNDEWMMMKMETRVFSVTMMTTWQRKSVSSLMMRHSEFKRRLENKLKNLWMKNSVLCALKHRNEKIIRMITERRVIYYNANVEFYHSTLAAQWICKIICCSIERHRDNGKSDATRVNIPQAACRQVRIRLDFSLLVIVRLVLLVGFVAWHSFDH